MKLQSVTCVKIPLTFLIMQLSALCITAQDILPPVPDWKGKSLKLIANSNDPWITPSEQSGFTTTPGYSETVRWLEKLCQSTQTMRMISIGKSASNRDISMVIASADANFDREELAASSKPLLLIQAGIHAGEIDGKDAGMMLLRDIATGKKKELLQGVNILFIPILNVDGHERSSEYNRVNQRGPSNMGWRTNARNLNLNRDYAKLDTEELGAVVTVMNEYSPDVYLDLHVTDGADYQYDITYGFSEGYSPSIGHWLKTKLSPAADQHLRNLGHIPGPLIFAANGQDFEDGIVEFPYSTRFSNNYGDIRHIPSVLVENHSLKPFRQRVLGTYVFIEAVIRVMTMESASLKAAIERDTNFRPKEVVLSWKAADNPDSLIFLGIQSVRKKSEVTEKDYVEWQGKPVTQKLPWIRNNKPDQTVRRPKAYWVPSTHQDVIGRLRLHGVRMEILKEPAKIEATMYRLVNHRVASTPFEGHVGVTCEVRPETLTETFYPGSARIDTDQPLGDLVVHLLEPLSPDSFLQWGFFMEIFNRTEYIEDYAIEPLARKMLLEDAKLRSEFEKKTKEDPSFASNADAVYQWFYERSPYVDARWLLYPVGIEY